MIEYLLDTNICIYVINNRKPEVRKKLFQINPSSIAVSSVCLSEMLYGAAKSHAPDKASRAAKLFCSNFQTLPFDNEDAETFGLIRAYLERRGCPIGPYDMQIAAQALTRNLILVTNNVREFERVPNLKIENWVSLA